MKVYRIKSLILILGDLFFFYAGLFLTLLLRYNYAEFEADFEKWWMLHLLPFSISFAVWIIIFNIAGLYDPLSFSLRPQVRDRVIRAMIFSGAISIVLFYTLPQFIITPKTNLIIDIAISTILILTWRKFYGLILARSEKTRVIFFGWSQEAEDTVNLLQNNPQLGYEVAALVLPDENAPKPTSNIPIFVFNRGLPKLIGEKRAGLVVASGDIRANADFIKILYEVLPLGVTYLNFPQFYEGITGKIPVSMISEMWFLENLAESEKRFFETSKRAFDIFAGFILGIIAALVLPFVASAIKLESSGSILFRQKRVGKNGRLFELIKFRTMVKNAENGQAVWAKENDKRITAVGRMLRKTRLDELPQIWNVIKGEMSLIGPRPERPEFVEGLKKQIPHYMMRLMVRPGLSGWAQINFPYGASVEDAMEKLQYDLYYIKNRSLGLDISIALKTLFIVVSRSGR
ncbi:MAG: sugar transferase [Patescibacteria group bacterium]